LRCQQPACSRSSINAAGGFDVDVIKQHLGVIGVVFGCQYGPGPPILRIESRYLTKRLLLIK
jgi:hypothetical protein